MSLRKNLAGAGLALGLILTFSVVAFGQQSTITPQDDGQPQQQGPGRRMGRRGAGGRMGHGGILRLLSQLNLTDAQRQQLSAIDERYQAKIKPQRDEMQKLLDGPASADTEARMQALRREMGQSMRGLRGEMMAVLTEDQRTQLEQLIRERKEKREARRGLNPSTD